MMWGIQMVLLQIWILRKTEKKINTDGTTVFLETLSHSRILKKNNDFWSVALMICHNPATSKWFQYIITQVSCEVWVFLFYMENWSFIL